MFEILEKILTVILSILAVACIPILLIGSFILGHFIKNWNTKMNVRWLERYVETQKEQGQDVRGLEMFIEEQKERYKMK